MPNNKKSKKTENRTFDPTEISENNTSQQFEKNRNQNHNTKKEALGPNTKRQG